MLGGKVTLAGGLWIEASGDAAGVARWFRRVVEQATGWRVEVIEPVAASGLAGVFCGLQTLRQLLPDS